MQQQLLLQLAQPSPGHLMPQGPLYGGPRGCLARTFASLGQGILVRMIPPDTKGETVKGDASCSPIAKGGLQQQETAAAAAG